MSEAPPAEGVADVKVVEIPLDADDTRTRHFRTLLGHPGTLIPASIVLVAVFIALSATVSAGIGAAGAGAVVLLTLIVVFLVANSMAQKDFFTAYAGARHLQWNAERIQAPPVTSLLRKGDRHYIERSFRGLLPGGLEGMLAHYTYEERTTGSNGQTETTYYHFTITMAELPELAPFVRELAVQRRVGFRFLDSAEDRFRTRQRVELESDVADRRFEVFIGKDDDMVRARQLFAPSFIVWLAEQAPEDFSFELSAGALVCAVKGHKKSAGELDLVCEGSATVARRLAEEARE
jgi:hypothetical protein